MDRTVVEKFFRTVHSHELQSYVGTSVEIGRAQSYNMVDMFLLAFSRMFKFNSRIVTVRRSAVLPRLVERRTRTVLLAKLEYTRAQMVRQTFV